MKQKNEKENDPISFGIKIFLGITSISTGGVFLYNNSYVAGILGIIIGIVAFILAGRKDN
jgi:hypothetical protein